VSASTREIRVDGVQNIAIAAISCSERFAGSVRLATRSRMRCGVRHASDSVRGLGALNHRVLAQRLKDLEPIAA